MKIKFKLYILIFTVSAILFGCGTTMIWEHPYGGTSAQFGADNIDCRMFAESNAKYDSRLKSEYYSSCMLSKGYTLKSSSYGFM